MRHPWFDSKEVIKKGGAANRKVKYLKSRFDCYWWYGFLQCRKAHIYTPEPMTPSTLLLETRERNS